MALPRGQARSRPMKAGGSLPAFSTLFRGDTMITMTDDRKNSTPSRRPNQRVGSFTDMTTQERNELADMLAVELGTIGSSLEDFLESEGISSEVSEIAREKISRAQKASSDPN